MATHKLHPTLFFVLSMLVSICCSQEQESPQSQYLFHDALTMNFKHEHGGNVLITIIGTLILMLMIAVVGIVLYKYCLFRMYQGVYKLSTRSLRDHTDLYNDEYDYNINGNLLNDDDFDEDSQYGTF
mmetsp:Transcript_69255/g.62158  ORF Transcript_69255/g.62158 Transcript_69255/m.62158 type:complete len:127 (+) Transcript_69255:50-430(+)